MSLNQKKLALTEERDAYFSRLTELKLHRARVGYSTDPAVLTEIDDIELKIAQLDASIVALDIVAEQMPLTGTPDRRMDDQRLHIMVATIQATVAEISNLKVFVHSEVRRVYKIMAYIGALTILLFLGLAVLIILSIRI